MGMHRSALVTALVAAVLLASAQPGSARTSKRPDLTVSRGSAAVVGSRLVGSFVARNTGRGTAARSAAVVRLADGTTLARFTIRRLKKHRRDAVRISVRAPSALRPGRQSVRVCLDVRHRVKERSERNNCRTIGSVSTPAAPPAGPAPPALLQLAPEVPTHVVDGVGDYWADVSTGYVPGTPTTLFVWLHGCGGDAEGDTWTVAPYGGQDFIAISVGGADGGCWDMTTGPGLVAAAIRSAESHFTIDPHRVFIGGYSSGGDLAYRTAFYDSRTYAGVLVTNTSPFRDTGSTAAQSLAAATSRFHVVHLLHTNDTTYPKADVVAELAKVRDAGFPVVQLERPGHHWDDPTDPVTGLGGTSGDIQTELVPYLDSDGAGWSSP